MAHKEQRDFCLKVKKLYPGAFMGKRVLDVGSLDINGSNRDLFYACEYTGIDVAPGKNVDKVCLGHRYNGLWGGYGTIISTECFEHDPYYVRTLQNIVRMLRPGGLFLFSCATTGRPEHGTAKTSPHDSPLTSSQPGWCDYYKNLDVNDITEALQGFKAFESYHIETRKDPCDLYFYGIKHKESETDNE